MLNVSLADFELVCQFPGHETVKHMSHERGHCRLAETVIGKQCAYAVRQSLNAPTLKECSIMMAD
jgi:hypothetical protein